MEQTKYSKGSRLFDSSYIIDGFIGEGTYGQVYLVHREGQADKKFAAKIIYYKETYTDAFWKKFAEEEVTSLRIMNQEGLVQTYDSFSVDKNGIKAKVLIMENVEGISLKDYLDEHGCLVPKVALNIFSKILQGIKKIHNFKHVIIHRDLKPENIVLSYDLSKITILDFGIATVLQNAQEDLESKHIKCFTDESGDQHGTVPYLIPDIFKKKQPGQDTVVTVQFDFFSLGVILYEMLMGERPFDYDKLPEGTSQKKRIELPLKFDIYNISSNPTITPTIENMIFKCLACKPEDLHFRYQNINEIIEDCNRAIASLDAKEDSTPLLKPLNKRIYPRFGRYDTEVVKKKVALYKTWPAFIVLCAVAIAILVTALIVFFK